MEKDTTGKRNSRSHCAAFQCTTSYSNEKTAHLFRFPADPDRCREWVKNTLIKNLAGKSAKELHSSYRLCQKHFEESQFANPSHSRLIATALPTVFDNLRFPTKPITRRNTPTSSHK